MTSKGLTVFALFLMTGTALAAQNKPYTPQNWTAPASPAQDISPQAGEAEPEDTLEPRGQISAFTEQDEDTIESEETVAKPLNEAAFTAIESYGILEQAAGQGLGRQFYSNSKRSVMTGLIKEMPSSRWTVMQDLSNQVLLTEGNTGALANDIAQDPSTGSDLLTLRIEKLLERGFLREAFTLFTRLEVDPFNEKIARLGIISMLLNGQKPLACVEMKTFEAPFKTGPFWQEMDAYCTLSLADGPLPEKQAIITASKEAALKRIVTDKSYRLSYSPAAFSALSLFERGLIIGENRIDISGLTDAVIAQIPADHVQALLALEPLSNRHKILLNARGVQLGVISPYEFARVYIRIGRKAEKEKTPLTGLDHIATLYWKRADTFLPEVRQATIAEVYASAKAGGLPLLIPFLEEISKIQPSDNFTLDQLDMLVRAYFMAGFEMPAPWLDRIMAVSAPTPAEAKRKEIILIAAALMSGDKGNSAEKLKEIYKILEKPQNSALTSLKNIIENIDNRTGSYAKVRYVYENGFDSGANKSYTMPPAGLMAQLDLSSDSHATGETVLLCNLILQGIEQRSIYSGILADVAKALSEVGISKQAQRLLAEVVLSL